MVSFGGDVVEMKRVISVGIFVPFDVGTLFVVTNISVGEASVK